MNDSTWTWLSGSNTSVDVAGVYGNKNTPNSGNYPGSRTSATGWFDVTTQEFWVFGGEGYDKSGNKGAFLNPFGH